MLAVLGREARRRASEHLAAAAAAELRAGGGPSATAQAARQWQWQPSRRVVAAAAAGTDQAAVLAKARRLSGPVGILAGVFGSVCGVGGGVIIVPAIVSSCKTIPQRLVSGTSLAAVLSTALVSAYTYSSSGCVDLAAASMISPAAMLTAPLGARLATRLDCAALRRILGCFLLAAAPLVPLKAYLLAAQEGEGDAGADAGARESSTGSNGSDPGPSPVTAAPAAQLASAAEGLQLPPPATSALLAATGAVAGLASGLLGVGGGVVVTPLLALLMPFPQATVLGTSLLAMIPPASVALLQHQRLGNVDWRMAAALAAGTAVGGIGGSNLAVQAPPGVLEAAFCVGMLFLGRKTLATAK